MSRRTRRPVQHVQLTPPSAPPADPVPGPGTPPVEAAIQPSPALFGGKGDHDANGSVGGAAAPVPSRVPVLTDEQQAAVDAAAQRENAPVPDRTLHELNLEARAVDRHHALKREQAQAAANEHVEPILMGIMRPRLVSRRLQRNLRPPVRE